PNRGSVVLHALVVARFSRHHRSDRRGGQRAAAGAAIRGERGRRRPASRRSAMVRSALAVQGPYVKRAKQHSPPRPRNPVARSPLLRRGGAHGKTTAAKRRQAKLELQKQIRETEPDA